MRRSFYRSKKILLLLFTLLLLGSLNGYAADTMGQEKEILNYVAFGDSLTAGLGAAEQNYLRMNAFVPRLTSELRKTYAVHVENHGIPGITSAQLLQYLQQGLGVKASIEAADLITITIGGNDLLQLMSAGELNQVSIALTIRSFGEQLTQNIAEIRSYNESVPIYIMDLYSPYDRNHPLHETGKHVISLYNQELANRIQNDDQVILVSVYDAFLDRGTELTHIIEGDIHPNDEGYRVIYEEFMKSLTISNNGR